MHPDKTEQPNPGCPMGTPDTRVHDSRELFGNGNRVVIRHGDADYLLQITRQGKLILTR